MPGVSVNPLVQRMPGQKPPVPQAAPNPNLATGAGYKREGTMQIPVQAPGGYREPITGAGLQYPLAGVPAPQQYDAATRLRLQQEAQGATSDLSAQEAAQGLKAQEASFAGQGGLAEKQAGYGQSQTRLEAQLQAEAEARRLGYLPQLTGGVSPQVEYGGPGGSQLEAARNAAFARAKDRAGQISKSALTGLRESMAARGVGGGGLETQAILQDVINPAAGGLSDINREQMIQELEGAQHGADVRYQGGIQQRGQNMNLLPMLQGLLTARALY